MSIPKELITVGIDLAWLLESNEIVKQFTIGQNLVRIEGKWIGMIQV